jgi:5-oxoprolinase (ATP-hydrolysing)
VTGWRIAVDRGGTFTDVVAVDPSGTMHVRKLLARGLAEEEALAELLPQGAVLDELRIGTTVATNALLTGQGARAALLVTRGFGDLLAIGHQARPDIFALNPRRLPPLVESVVAVSGRLRVDGSVEEPLDEGEARRVIRGLIEDGIGSIGIALLHAWRCPDHEVRLGEIALQEGAEHVSLSHRLAPEPGLLDRAVTTEADAWLTPVVRRYLAAVEAVVPPGARLLAMKSSGGLCAAEDLSGVAALLSGPAGGAVACGHVAERAGFAAVLGFDMGGTSTDVCRWAGDVERRSRLSVAGRTLAASALDVATVAAGGGSKLLHIDGRFEVGPESAGADPGPACYGRGGPAAVTDANLVLGRVQPDLFPAVFGPQRSDPLDRAGAEAALDGLGVQDVRAAAAGFVAVANATMAAAISELSTARGHDPAAHALLAFGGAAGQHGCAVAERLGIRDVLFHPLGGVLSALGIAQAPRVAIRSVAVEVPWSSALAASRAARAAPLIAACSEELERAGASPSRIRVRWALRYAGSDTVLQADDRAAFEREHRRTFGFVRPGVRVEAAQLRVSVRSDAPKSRIADLPLEAPAPPPRDHRQIGFPSAEGDVRWLRTPTFALEDLPAGCLLRGPALVASATTTVVIDPGWTARLDGDGALRAHHHGQAVRAARAERDPARLELYHRRFMSLASRMGETLRRVAWSVNIKERLDFSCALFDAGGHLVANAPHIPVHLGAMGETVRGLASRVGAGLRSGRSWAVNDPRLGGSHLPDITVITPVFVDEALVGWVANRGHHADLGGRTPGSMPPDSRSLAEEGVVLRDLLLVDGGVWQAEAVQDALVSGGGAFPPRQPHVNIADLQAQVAANALGAELLVALAVSDGVQVVAAWMQHVQDNGAEAVEAWLDTFGPDPRRFEDALDDGTPIAVALERTGAPGRWRLDVDFEGTGARSPGNLNAPPAVARAAVLYVLRCAVGRSIPMNAGCLRAVDVRLPAGSLLDPAPESAVVGGNVETSQRLVDVLLGALGLAAASQGTMNNLTLGTARGAYYETLAGGAGATAHASGSSAVQTHMTNTRITDVEVLELRFPIQVRRFGLARGTGGEGRRRGGDGVVRTLRFLEAAEVALLSQRRTRAPFGLEGGSPGAVGRAVLRSSGHEELLGGCFTRRVSAGDELEVQTPGGGGFGAPDLADM